MGFFGKSLVAALVLLSALPAAARPVAYADGYMVMQMNDPFSNSLTAIYSPTARLGIGPVVEHWRASDTNFAGLQVNGLLKRWNNPDSQGNFYLLTSVGAARGSGANAPSFSLGIEADWEDRRYYVSYENRYTSAGEIMNEYTQKARAGIAPYVAEYGSLHTWLMLQVDHRPEDADNFTVTPLVRLFKGTWLGEAGVSHRGDILFNTVLTF